jgi:hypothetical protein
MTGIRSMTQHGPTLTLRSNRPVRSITCRNRPRPSGWISTCRPPGAAHRHPNGPSAQRPAAIVRRVLTSRSDVPMSMSRFAATRSIIGLDLDVAVAADALTQAADPVGRDGIALGDPPRDVAQQGQHGVGYVFRFRVQPLPRAAIRSGSPQETKPRGAWGWRMATSRFRFARRLATATSVVLVIAQPSETMKEGR